MIIEETTEDTIESWQKLHLWLRLLWPDDWSGFLAFCSDEDGQLKQQWKACSETASLSRQIAEQSQLKNLWVSCCSFSRKERSSSAALELPGIWVDIDTKENHRTNSGELPTDDLPTTEEALAALDRLPVPPSLIVSSGGGLYVWWLFDTPQRIDDRKQLQTLLKWWEGQVRKELNGKHLDTTSDFARILRVPGLLNHKYQKTVEFFRPELTGKSYAENQQQLRDGVLRHQLEDFLRLLPEQLTEDREDRPSEYSEQDRKEALSAVKRMKPGRADDYSTWVKVGLCLAEIEHSAEMFEEWMNWSRQSPKFLEDQLEQYRSKWDGFSPEGNGFAVGNLVAMANEDDPPAEVAVVGIQPNPKRQSAKEFEPLPELRSFQPFPVDALPSPFDEMVENGARSLQVDPSMVAVPLLSVLAGAIGGNSHRLVVKKGWTEPPIVWTVTSADSGTGKTHAFDLAVEPVTEIQRRAFRRYDEEKQSFEILKTEYDRQLAQWKKEKGQTSRPEPPIKPTCWRLKIDDTTVEALVARLAENSRGLLVAVDELSGFFGSFDRYSSGSGDESKWLRAYDGKDLTSDRKTGDFPVTYVPRAGVSISGTIQPELLRKYFTAERMESGLVSRFLIVEPPELDREGWIEDEVDQELKDRCLEIIEALTQFEGELVEDGRTERKPVFLGLSRSGREAFVDWCRYHQKLQTDTFGAVRAAYAKLKSIPARLGLIFHLTRRAAGDTTLENPDQVDSSSIEAGRRIAEFFRNEIERLYSTFGETPIDREERKLLQLIQTKGGEITPRNLCRASRLFRPVDNATAILQKMVDGGRGNWREDRPSGGGPTSKVFVLK
jgi:hypothetical protein